MWGCEGFPPLHWSGGLDLPVCTDANPMMGLRQADDPIVTGAIYRRTLKFVPDDEPLKGIVYIGQTVRGGTAGENCAARWEEENRQAGREDKSVGLMAALDMFGSDAFEDEILETKRGPREVVAKWADYREVELIAQHGGPLQDMDPTKPIRQTLNLTSGGQGTKWYSIEARCAKMWKTFLVELDAFIAREEHADVPKDHVSASGYRLGQTLNSVRQGVMLDGRPDEPGRRALLESKGVKWKMHDAKWEKFLVELDIFIARKEHADVPQRHVSVSGYPLGNALMHVRRGQMLDGKPDEAGRRALLESKGVKWRVRASPCRCKEEPWLATPSIVQRTIEKARAKRAQVQAKRLEAQRASPGED